MSVATPDRMALYDAMKFPDKLRKHRTERRMTQQALADNVGVAQNQVARWEAGSGRPYYDQVLRIARALDVPVEYLCDDEMESPSEAHGGVELSEGDRAVLAIVRQRGLPWVLLALTDPPQIRATGQTREQQ
jgi:transcriptional regulator with XRE-family HTH domain